MELNKYYSKVFFWMFIGLMISFITGYYVSLHEAMLMNLSKTGALIFLCIIEVVLVIVLSSQISKIQVSTARILFALYSFVTGLTFSSVFVIYQISSVILVFAETGLLFGIFAFLGHYTKMDLTKIGNYLFMGLIGILIASIVNIFMKNTTLDLLLNIFGIFLFLGYTAYDIQKIKLLASSGYEEEKLSIIGALQLYLDFMNLFIDLLELFGKRND